MIFLLSRLNTGGTQYYILSLVKALKKQSINSKVLVIRKKDLDHKILKEYSIHCETYFLSDFGNFFIPRIIRSFFPFFGVNSSKIKDFLSNQKIHVTCPFTYFVLKSLLPKKNLNKISYGVYHARTLSWGRDGNLTLPEIFFRKKLFNDEVLLLFGPEKTRKDAIEINKITNTEKFLCVPTGIELLKPIRKKNINNKIVIIGRLVKHKKFILGTIEILKDLSNKNIKIDVIGDGDYKNTLEQKCKNLSLEERVSFLGNVEKKDLLFLIEDSDIIVSSGTSLTYLSSSGIPSIIALEEHKYLSPGFLHDLEDYNFSESSFPENFKLVCIKDLINTFYNDPEKVNNLSFENNYKIVEKLDINLVSKKFIESHDLKKIKFSTRSYIDLYVWLFLSFLSDSINIILGRNITSVRRVYEK